MTLQLEDLKQYQQAKHKVLKGELDLPIVKRMFAVLDRKSNVYDNPWFAESKIEAIRAFAEILQKEAHPMARYPEDYWLVELGIFERRSGKLDLHEIPDNLGSLAEYKQK